MKKVYQPQSRKSYVVKRAIKRELVRGIVVLFIISFVLLFCTFFARSKAAFLALVISGFVFLIFAMVLFFKVNRCPYCGRMFTGLHWSAPDAGPCQGCGKLIQYTDKNQPKGKFQMQQQAKKKKK